MGIFLKDPGATLDYAVDWATLYLASQTISASQWVIAPAELDGIVLTAEISSPTRTAATLAGGVPGHVYRITNRVTLSDGRSDERTLTVRTEQR